MSSLHLTPTGLDENPPPQANGSPPPGHSRPAAANGQAGHRALPSRRGGGRRRWLTYLAGLVGLAVLVGGPVLYFATRPAAARPDVLTHKVARATLNVTVVEKGTLESAENADIICKVRAGNKGFASTINWVIDDGTKVSAGQLVMILDDSALQDQFRDQRIVVDNALAAKVDAEKNYEITIKRNQQNVAIAEIELEKSGLDPSPFRLPLAAAAGAPALITEPGTFQQEFDDLTGQIRLAESEVEQNRERAAWADRMVKMRYMSPAQAQAERSRLDSSEEKLRSLVAKRRSLNSFDKRQRLIDLRGKLENARLVADAERAQADQKMVSARSVYGQAVEKLNDIGEQIKECRIHAPQAGMVVYFKNESSRFSSSPTGLIEQGAQVKEGQKMLRIPNLDVMQVNTKIHEAMVRRIRGDVRVSTGLVEQFRAGQLANPDPLSRVISQQDGFQEAVRDKFKDREYMIARKGQDASVRVDAMSDRVLKAHVKSVAAVASQTDSWVSDVKLFPTLVLIEEKVEGLKPDMTAEVTIQVTGVENVLCVPVQSVVGGTEMGAKRKVWVKSDGPGAGFEEREVVLGIYNEKMVEVREGLTEGDEVVINPKVLMGDNKAKTRDGDNQGGGDTKGGDAKGGGGGYPKGGGGAEKGGGGGGADPGEGPPKKGGKKGGGGGGGGPQGPPQ